MADNILKKEFKKNDVERMRNLIQGKGSESSTSQVGYKKAYVERAEGDIWEEDERMWTIKDGLRQNITKLDKAKKAHIMPLFCPECKKPMNYKFDNSFWKIHNKCYNCVIEFENELKRTGKWEEYEKNIHNAEIDNLIKEYKIWFEEQLEDNSKNFITETGVVENWVGGINEERAKESLTDSLKYLEDLKK